MAYWKCWIFNANIIHNYSLFSFYPPTINPNSASWGEVKIEERSRSEASKSFFFSDDGRTSHWEEVIIQQTSGRKESSWRFHYLSVTTVWKFDWFFLNIHITQIYNTEYISALRLLSLEKEDEWMLTKLWNWS